MTTKMKVHTVSFEGLDKTGKSTLVKYLARMSDFTLVILDRGPLTNIVWNKILNRDVEYDLEMWKSTLFIKLTADEEDWKIRCGIHNEPPMPLSFKDMNKAYDEAFEYFKTHGFYVLEFNTTKMTQYKIAKKIIDTLNDINRKEKDK